MPGGLATVVATAGFLVAIQASILWSKNGWNATHAVMCEVAATLVVGAVGGEVAEGGE